MTIHIDLVIDRFDLSLPFQRAGCCIGQVSATPWVISMNKHMDDIRRRSRKSIFVVAALIGVSCASLSTPRWEQLPEPAPLPAPMVSAYAPVSGVSIY